MSAEDRTSCFGASEVKVRAGRSEANPAHSPLVIGAKAIEKRAARPRERLFPGPADRRCARGSPGRPAAIDHDVLAGDVRAGVADEKRQYALQVLLRPHAIERR